MEFGTCRIHACRAVSRILRGKDEVLHHSIMKKLAEVLSLEVNFLFFQKEYPGSEYAKYIDPTTLPIEVSEIGKKIRNNRKKQGYTGIALAEKARVSTTFIHRVETGKKGRGSSIQYP